MLSESSYHLAMGVYLAAGLLAALVFMLWARKLVGGAWAFALGLLAAALLLTPAWQGADAETLAPALIVAGFEWATDSREAADHALRPLAWTCGLALAAGLLVVVLAAFRRQPKEVEDA